MNKQILCRVTVVERKPEEARKTAYAAPRVFAVGSAVELIQGGHFHTWLDWDRTWTKEHR